MTETVGSRDFAAEDKTMYCVSCHTEVYGGVSQHENRLHGGAQTCWMLDANQRRADRKAAALGFQPDDMTNRPGIVGFTGAS